MIGFGLLLVVAGCTSSNGQLSELAGGWVGTATVEGVASEVSATFTFENDEYLAGQITIGEPRGTQRYSVRRAEVVSRIITVDAQTTESPVQNLDLDGNLDGGEFTGTATMRVECEGRVEGCGWQGPFQLRPGEPLVVTDTDPQDTGLELGDTDDTDPIDDTDTDPVDDTDTDTP